MSTGTEVGLSWPTVGKVSAVFLGCWVCSLLVTSAFVESSLMLSSVDILLVGVPLGLFSLHSYATLCLYDTPTCP